MGSINKKLNWTVVFIVIAAVTFIVLTQLIRFHPNLLSSKVTVTSQHVGIVSGVNTDVENTTSPMFYLVRPENQENHQFNNFKYALQYAKLPYKIIEPDEIQSLTPTAYTVLVTSDEAASNRLSLEEVTAFVENGGKLYVGKRFYSPKWNELVGIQGIYSFTDKHTDKFGNIYGLTILNSRISSFFPETDYHAENMVNNSLNLELNDNAELHIKTEDIPLYWTHSFHKGMVGYWNGTWLGTKQARGLFLQTILEMLPLKVNAMAGIKTVFIDDFPAPFPQNWKEEVAEYYLKEYNMQPPTFFQKIWWEDMKLIAREQDLLYTNVIIGDYSESLNLTVNEMVARNKKQLLYYARDTILRGDELGLHGFNHQSLVTNKEEIDKELGYIPWKSKEEMKKGIYVMNALLEEYYPSLQYEVYVPPSNVIGPTGINAIYEALPSLKVISAVYEGDQLGALEQEFEYDAEKQTIFHFPRLSSGYVPSANERNMAIDGLANFGMFSHFVHPDDLTDEDRSENYTRPWKDMKAGFQSFLSSINTKYPVLEPYTASEAADYMKAYVQGSLTIEYGEDSIVVSGENMPTPVNLSVQLAENETIAIDETSDVTVYQTNSDLPIYQIKTTKLPVVIPIASLN
ncbi:DUF2194 domain-containing protein [Bacillus sp. HMF5848]|uniref:DUF2194 domain-containing protein n=1 Tax=Bacillus sp. HMF5848 TaxID=2495421 RepID=UPI000F768C96|nr:DUF2194 domain-containing protein [Bacillus sp. HMF5848]RSK28323.1 DUF2194 domain-containing protein [Bacillus sp. HMF5848]